MWDIIARLVNAGYTAETAIARIHQCYGQSESVTNITRAIKAHKKDGGHPNLRVATV